jgi:formylglycine-generating enzyme required for sulfatase activity
VTVGEWRACVAAGACREADAGQDVRRPVANVSWDDASAYVAWLGRRTGKRYALPSEAEWEYAARAGRRSAYPWGDAIGRGMAACDGCGTAFDATAPAPVGSFPANAFGLFDTAGNVWEWVRDCWSEIHAAPDPGPPADRGCARHTVKGGSYLSRPHRLRNAAREGAFTTSRDGARGFRVMREVD